MTHPIEIINERAFAVDQARLFQAFADPQALAQWWGPHGFSNRVDELDIRVGGAFRITMTNSDGADFHNHCTFQEVRVPERIVYIHHEPMHVFTMEMDFSPEGEGSRLRWRMLFEDNDENRAVAKFIQAANEQNFDRLEAHLAGRAS